VVSDQLSVRERGGGIPLGISPLYFQGAGYRSCIGAQVQSLLQSRRCEVSYQGTNSQFLKKVSGMELFDKGTSLPAPHRVSIRRRALAPGRTPSAALTRPCSLLLLAPGYSLLAIGYQLLAVSKRFTMTDPNPAAVNVKQAVPFFGVTNMEASLKFYVDGLGFKMKNYWIPDRASEHGGAEPDGRIRWCWLELGTAAIMLQEFWPGRRPEGTLGTGVNICFQCEDALALYREFKSRGIEMRNRPFVGNRLWVVGLTDPDGYRMEFSSPTDAPEESELEEGTE
jgi:lactoylglutathione lyase